MYSFANHAWVTTVGTVLIGPWLDSLAKNAAGGSNHTLVQVFGLQLRASAYPSLVIALAAIAQIFVLPAIGARADAMAAKKRFLSLCCGAGSILAALLATTGGEWLYAGVIFLLGTIVFGASDVVYNSFLPSLAPPERRAAASSRGFAIGYLGSGLLLALNLALLQLRGRIGLSEATAVRICFVSAGIWWAGFGLWSIRGFSQRGTRRTSAGGLAQLRVAFRQLATMPNAARYLVAYLFFSDAISAVIGLSSLYITHELYDDNATKASPFLFGLILAIQFVAIAGSLLFARISRRAGEKRTIMLSLLIWCAVIVYAYAALHSTLQAAVMGVVIGLVLGGSQAISRSLFSQMIPAGREATFFGMYEICDRGTSWLAPLLFTVVVNATGSFRQAILSLIVLFAAGTVILATTDTDKARAEAQAA